MEPGLIPFDVSTLKQIHPLLYRIHVCEHIVSKLKFRFILCVIQIHLLVYRIHVCVHRGPVCPQLDATGGGGGCHKHQWVSNSPTPDMGQTGGSAMCEG